MWKPTDCSPALAPHEIDVDWARPGCRQRTSDFIHTLLHTLSAVEDQGDHPISRLRGILPTRAWTAIALMSNTTYGTASRSAYKIIEETLNLRDVRAYTIPLRTKWQ